MKLTLPTEAVLVDLSRPEHAVTELATVVDRIRNMPSLSAENEGMARQMIDEVIRNEGCLLAVLPDGAVLTGATVRSTLEWNGEYTNELCWRLDDTGHETVTMDTALGPVAVAERRTAGTYQLQAFLTEPHAVDMFVLTLSSRSAYNWNLRRAEFLDLVGAAMPSPDSDDRLTTRQ